MRVAAAPLSYGVFELTVGRPGLPGPDALLREMALAGYEGTELGPPGYLGEGSELEARLEQHGLELIGGWCQLRFSEPDEDFAELRRVLDLFEAAGAQGARPVFGDAGSKARRAAPGRGADTASLRLDEAGWARFAEGLKRAESIAGERGFEPVFHAHLATFVEAPAEIDRMLGLSDIGLAVDTGHLLLGGSDPIAALRDWGARVEYVHLKDVRTGIAAQAMAERVDALEAWRRGIFCEFGAGDVDLEGFLAALRSTGYDGWVCVEQDRIPRDGEPLSESAQAQIRNRDWLRQRGL